MGTTPVQSRDIAKPYRKNRTFISVGPKRARVNWPVIFALMLVSTAVALPMLLIAPAGGVVADRVDRRTLVAVGQLAVIVSELSILVLMITGNIRFWHLLVSGFVLGTVFSFIMPARQALVANAVGRHGLTNAMALNMAAINTTRIVGPAAAGLLIGLTGLQFAWGLNVAFFILALAFLKGVDAAPPQHHDQTGRASGRARG